MRLKLALAGALLSLSMAAQANPPIIKGNTMIKSEILDRNIAYGKPKNYDDVAKIIVGLYEQYGYVGVKAVVEDNVITIIEPGSQVGGDYDNQWVGEQGQVLEVNDIEGSMAMADVNNRFEVMDVAVGDIRADGKVNVDIKRTKSDKPYAGSVSYSSLGQDASARDLVTLTGGTHVGGGVRVDGAATVGLSSLREDSKGGKYNNVFFSAKKATPYGEFSGSYSTTENEIGGKEATRYDYQLAGDTKKATVGHRYVVAGTGQLVNSLNWVKREQNFGLFNLQEEQDYKTWNGRYYGDFAGHQVNVSLTKGLSGSRDYNLIPLMGEFDPKFHAIQVGYATSGVFPINVLGYGVSASYFTGSKEMPSAERMSLGGPGRGSSHNNGAVSGYKGYFGEARLYGMNSLVKDFSLRPYLSVNGGQTTDAIGESISIYAAEAGLLGKIENVSGGVSYAESIKTENIDKDRRLNMNVKYDF